VGVTSSLLRFTLKTNDHHKTGVIGPKGWNAGSLVVVIPLSLPKRFIEKKLAKLLARHHKRKKGQRTYKESRALYSIATQFRPSSLKKLLELYDLHQSQPGLKEWQLAQSLRLGDQLTKDELEGGRGRDNPTAVEKKQILSVAVSKKLRDAKVLSMVLDAACSPRFRSTNEQANHFRIAPCLDGTC
jgi:hypothetical protein